MISYLVNDLSVIKPEMIHGAMDIFKGGILAIKTSWNKSGWRSLESVEFRYMVKHLGESVEEPNNCYLFSHHKQLFHEKVVAKA